MIKIRITALIIIMIMIISIATTSVFAADHTFTFSVNPETVSVKAGETVTINLAISDIDQTTDGINAIQGELEYNTEMFENVSLRSTAENWSAQYDEAGNGTFMLFIMGSEKESKNVAKLTATVKRDTELTSGTITFKNVFSSYQDLTETEKTTKIVTVNVEAASDEPSDEPSGDGQDDIIDPSDDTTPTTPDEKDTTPSNPSNSGNSTTPSNPSSSSSRQSQTSGTSTKTVLPKAGIESWIAIVIAAVAIVGLIEFIKYKRAMK